MGHDPHDAEQGAFYTAEDVARLLGVTKQTALRWLAAGKIPGALQPQVRGVWRINRRVFDNWMAHGTLSSPEKPAQEAPDGDQ